MSERSSGSDQINEPGAPIGGRNRGAHDQKRLGGGQDAADQQDEPKGRPSDNNRPRRRRPKPKKDGSNRNQTDPNVPSNAATAPVILLNPHQLNRSGSIPAPSASNSESTEVSTTINAPKPASPAPNVSVPAPVAPSSSRNAAPKAAPVSAPSEQPAAPSAAATERTAYASVKLINEQQQMNTEALFKLLSDDVNSDFVVIGVIGRQSVGKSTLLNALAGHTKIKPFNAPSDAARKKPPFKVATANTMLLAQHQTHGVDAYVTSERHILLDCEPIDSASVLTRMLRLETPLLPEVKSHEAMAYLVGLRTCIWLMSVCNIILVVDDGLGVTNLFKHFEAVQMLRWMLPQDVSDLIPPNLLSNTANQSYSSQYTNLLKKELEKFRNMAEEDVKRVRDQVLREAKAQQQAQQAAAGAAKTQIQPRNQATLPAGSAPVPYDPLIPLYIQDKSSAPEMIFVLNKQAPLYSPSPKFHKSTTDMLKRTLWRLPSFHQATSSSSQPGGTTAPIEPGLFVLPLFAEDGSEDDITRVPLGQSWSVAMLEFRMRLLYRKGRQFRKGFSEKEWLKSAVRMWDIVRTTPLTVDYINAMRATLFADQRASDSTT
eukprot:TRINITY_DN3945_c0_g1_i2.p1 TRINITY_DN3945_c0_g1~~TRINITY_DN3945_c0_g1_i2.p1  ORF type:complete len:600 (+),score=119.62 TRINITY_DN3945_c0_g1_i2:662-2461(+)